MMITSSKCRPRNSAVRFWLTLHATRSAYGCFATDPGDPRPLAHHDESAAGLPQPGAAALRYGTKPAMSDLEHAVFFIHIAQISASQELLAGIILTSNLLRREANGVRQYLGGNHHNTVVIRKHEIAGRHQHTAAVHRNVV